MNRLLVLISVLCVLSVWCAEPISTDAGQAAIEDSLRKSAVSLSEKLLIVDTHIDTPYSVRLRPRDVSQLQEVGEFDLPRAEQGGLNVAFMSIYTSATAAEEGTSKDIADELVTWAEELSAANESRVQIAKCVAAAESIAKEKLAFVLGMENGSPLEGNVANLREWYDRGIRYITLAHSRSNEFSDSSYDENEQWGGLSLAGVELVKAMNDLGVMIDVSHLTDAATWQVLEHSAAPVIASHSSLRHFVPDFHRNLPDDLVTAIGDAGGVVMINFGSRFISSEAGDWSIAYTEARTEYVETKTAAETEPTSDELSEFREAYQEANPYLFSTVPMVADHIDRVVELAGIDAVGFGSDFDGVGDTLPIDLKDVSDYPKLILELLRRGYSEDDLAKIAGLNLMRVWSTVESYATSQGTELACES